ncbi:Rieske (2Fe-2S) protein [Streptomyces kanasensis]|uniref:Rieske (2Fe-2S) protein n=1 Tax=Streptomyces kanasensis TaxID=936756 RepID=UPI0037035555
MHPSPPEPSRASALRRRTVLTGTLTPAATPALAAACGDDGGPAGKVVASTADVPVGGGTVVGGTVVAAEKVVVTQPVEDGFRAFSAVCGAHQGCTVGSVADGLIVCPCHAGRFRVTDGSVAAGPAKRPPPARRITVAGGDVRPG